jgi:hypothetical protein
LVENGKEGEFDLVIVTHCNVIIVELKHWNNDNIICKGDKWFLGNKDMGRSPVSVTQGKKFLTETTILEKTTALFLKRKIQAGE